MLRILINRIGQASVFVSMQWFFECADSMAANHKRHRHIYIHRSLWLLVCFIFSYIEFATQLNLPMLSWMKEWMKRCEWVCDSLFSTPLSLSFCPHSFCAEWSLLKQSKPNFCRFLFLFVAVCVRNFKVQSWHKFLFIQKGALIIYAQMYVISKYFNFLF